MQRAGTGNDGLHIDIDPAESVTKYDKLAVDRAPLVNQLHTLLDLGSSILVRGPAASGKTAAAQLLVRDLNLPPGRIVYVSLATYTTGCLEAFVLRKASDVGLSFASMSEMKLGLDVIIFDDAHTSFKEKTFWTSLLKEGRNAKIVVLAAYLHPGTLHSNDLTPAEFDARVSFSGLKLQRSESMAIIDQWLPNSHVPMDAMDADVKDLILALTAGHVGLLRKVLQSIENQSVIHHKRHEEFPLTRFLMSPELVQSESFNRCFLLPPKNSVAEFDITISVVLEGSAILTESQLEIVDRLIETCVILVRPDPERPQIVEFVSPLHRAFVLNHLYPARGTESPTDINSFIVDVIKGMSRSLLQATHKQMVSHIGELALSHQFYMAAMTVLPPNHRPLMGISKGFMRDDPVQGEHGGVGHMDMFINHTLQWLVEMFVQGNSKRADELNRVRSDGRYARIVNPNEARVLEFSQPGSRFNRPCGVTRDDTHVQITFADNFATAKIVHMVDGVENEHIVELSP